MSSKVIKIVAGGGKTTSSLEYLKANKNGLYLAFTNSVVNDIKCKGYLSKTIDSLFISFIFPKFTSVVPLIADGSKISFYQNEDLKGYLKGAGNIKIRGDGIICNRSRATEVSLMMSNANLYKKSKFPNDSFIKFIFGRNKLNINDQQRAELAHYLLNNYSKEIIKILRSRFSYIVIDEAQDLNGYREEFAKLIFDSDIDLIIMGDDFQNVNGGGSWFPSLFCTEFKNISYRCPDTLCKWIRENLEIEIYGNSDPGEYVQVEINKIKEYDDGRRWLLYNSKTTNVKSVVESWNGPTETIRKAKGMTIYEDIVIVGKTLNKNNLYTAITRTKKSVYSTIE